MPKSAKPAHATRTPIPTMASTAGDLLVHQTTVTLPAHGFAAHKLERACLTRRRLTRVPLTPVQAARRAMALRQVIPVAPQLDPEPTSDLRWEQCRSWQWPIGTVLLLLAIIVLAGWSCGLLHAH